MRPPRSGGKMADGRFRTTRKYIAADGLPVAKTFVAKKGESNRSVILRADAWQAESRGKIPSPNMTLRLAMDTWLEHRDAKLSARTKVDYRESLNRLTCLDQRISTISVYQVEQQIQAWADKPRSAQKIRTVGRALYNWLMKMGWAESNPFRDSEPVRYEPPIWEEPLSEDAIEKIIAATSREQFRVAFMLLDLTGVRPEAVRLLMWSDLLHREDGLWMSKRVKSDASALPVPIPAVVAERLLALPRKSLFIFPGRYGAQMDEATLTRAWSRAVIAAGFARVRAHSTI